jgi:hypothetical protein
MNTAMKYALPEGGAAGTKAIWVGRILSALAIAFFVMDGVMKSRKWSSMRHGRSVGPSTQ